MFAKFFNWLLGRTETDFYRSRERFIYSFWNGERVVHADPQVLYTRIAEHGPELSIDLKVGRSPMKGAKESHERAIQTIRDAFGFKAPPADNPLECADTLTQLEVEQELNKFLSWCEELKKKLPPTLTTAAAASPNGASLPAAAPPTPSGLASGSTVTAANTEPPGPSPTGPELPSEPSTRILTITEPTPTARDKPS